MTLRVLLAGGGTGGHVLPSLATAAALTEADADLEVEFLGTAGRLESRLVPEAGWRLHEIPAAPLPRRPDPALLRLPLVLGQAVRRARALIAEREAAVAVCFGGYVALPLALAARRAGIPLVVHEQNAVPGLANRLAAPLAAAIAVTFPDALERFGRTGRRVVVTGNPVRAELVADARAAEALPARRAAALAAFGLDPARRTLLVFGGSQGARTLNTALTASVERWQDPGSVQVLHATGSTTYAATRAAWDAALGQGPRLLVRCVEYLDRMDLAYAAADLVVCRAGATSIAEVTALGLPAVLVPYPHATADHQTANGRALAASGAALMVPDVDLTPARLVATAEPLLANERRLELLAAGARAWGRPDAARAVAALVLEQLPRQPAPTGAAA